MIAVHTPGHASDHLCYYLVEEKALFTGDVVLAGSTTVIPAGDGDLLDYMNSLKRLQGLDVRRIYPAHGPVIEDGPGRIAEYIEHRLMRERQILGALGDGLATIPEMVAKIYADVLRANRMCLCGMLASDYATLPKPMRERVRHFFDENERWLARVLDDGRSSGQLAFKGAPIDLARMIVASLEGAMMLARSYGEPPRFDAAAERVVAELEARKSV